MESDRTLLELAAKAAGYFHAWNEKLDCLEVWNQGERTTRFWQPHRDDADALRLAVKLGVLASPRFWHFLALERFSGQEHDDCRAHRRAIVRCAAELGKLDSKEGAA